MAFYILQKKDEIVKKLSKTWSLENSIFALDSDYLDNTGTKKGKEVGKRKSYVPLSESKHSVMNLNCSLKNVYILVSCQSSFRL